MFYRKHNQLARESCAVPGMEEVFGSQEDFLKGLFIFYDTVDESRISPTGRLWWNIWQGQLMSFRKKVKERILLIFYTVVCGICHGKSNNLCS